MPKSPKSRKPLQGEFFSNQNEILKRGMTWTEQKPKGTTFKVQSIAIANPLNIDLIHQCMKYSKREKVKPKKLSKGLFYTVGQVLFIHSVQVDKTCSSTLIFATSQSLLLVYLRGVWRVNILSELLMGAKLSLLGPILSYPKYMKSAPGRFPLSHLL